MASLGNIGIGLQAGVQGFLGGQKEVQEQQIRQGQLGLQAQQQRLQELQIQQAGAQNEDLQRRYQNAAEIRELMKDSVTQSQAEAATQTQQRAAAAQPVAATQVPGAGAITDPTQAAQAVAQNAGDGLPDTPKVPADSLVTPTQGFINPATVNSANQQFSTNAADVTPNIAPVSGQAIWEKKFAPQIFDHYIQNGDIEGAKNFSDFVQSSQGKRYIDSYAKAMQLMATGDKNGALKLLTDFRNGELNDGTYSQYRDLGNGQTAISHFDTKSGRTKTETINDEELPKAIVSYASPEKLADYMAAQGIALTKAKAEIGLKDHEFNNTYMLDSIKRGWGLQDAQTKKLLDVRAALTEHFGKNYIDQATGKDEQVWISRTPGDPSYVKKGGVIYPLTSDGSGKSKLGTAVTNPSDIAKIAGNVSKIPMEMMGLIGSSGQTDDGNPGPGHDGRPAPIASHLKRITTDQGPAVQGADGKAYPLPEVAAKKLLENDTPAMRKAFSDVYGPEALSNVVGDKPVGATPSGTSTPKPTALPSPSSKAMKPPERDVLDEGAAFEKSDQQLAQIGNRVRILRQGKATASAAAQATAEYANRLEQVKTGQSDAPATQTPFQAAGIPVNPTGRPALGVPPPPAPTQPAPQPSAAPAVADAQQQVISMLKAGQAYEMRDAGLASAGRIIRSALQNPNPNQNPAVVQGAIADYQNMLRRRAMLEGGALGLPVR